MNRRQFLTGSTALLTITALPDPRPALMSGERYWCDEFIPLRFGGSVYPGGLIYYDGGTLSGDPVPTVVSLPLKS